MLLVLINTHLLMASRDAGVGKYFFASSACVYIAEKQSTYDLDGLDHARGRIRLGKAVFRENVSSHL
jgi:hypothetical protein